MKIDLNNIHLDSTNIDRATLRQTQQAATTEINAEGTQGDDDAASLSLNHTSMQSLASQALSSPAIRQDKVEALRQAIANGTYQLAPEQIADAMIQDSTALEP
jgi:negative regulator of flagellin synthesis FlgM